MIESNGVPRILVAHEDALMRKLVSEALRQRRKAFKVEECGDPAEVIAAMESNGFSLLILDVGASFASSVEHQRELRRRGNTVPVVLMCREAPLPARLTGLGPIHVLLKPFGLRDLATVLEVALPPSPVPDPEAPDQTAIVPLAAGIGGTSGPEGLPGVRCPSGALSLPGHSSTVPILGRSPKILSVIDLARRVASTNATVLIVGESGTGKELVARAIHSQGPGAKGPFVDVNSAALTETLLESELFGHEKGAFTSAIARRRGKFEQAHGGTLFFDEIGDMPLATQAKLLRVLQERSFQRVGGEERIEVNVRVICATNRSLDDLVAKGAFRVDLFWRLNVVAVRLPALAERMEDIPILVEAFVKKFGEMYGKGALSVSEPLLELFLGYSWPGNVRELENVISRLVTLAAGSELDMKDLPEGFGGSKEPGGGNGHPKSGSGTIRREALVQALKRTNGNRSAAAKILGISRRWLYALIQRYHLLQV